jgi:hypothetical protein
MTVVLTNYHNKKNQTRYIIGEFDFLQYLAPSSTKAPISLSAFVHKLLSGMLHVSSIRGSVRKMRIYNDKEIPN